MNFFLNRLFEGKDTLQDALSDRSETEARKRGRPRAWDSVDMMQSIILEYFTLCLENTKTVANLLGEPMKVADPKIPTMAGLALVLGIDRKTLYNYSQEDYPFQDFFPTVKAAKQYLEAITEDKMNNDKGANVAALIFNLKNNFGQVDKYETDNKNENNNKQSGEVTYKVEIITDDTEPNR